MNAKKNKEFKIGEVVVYPKHGVGEIMKSILDKAEPGAFSTLSRQSFFRYDYSFQR